MQKTSSNLKRTIVITGASNGIGKIAAKELAKTDTVVVIGRSIATKDVANSIGADYYIVDFSNLSDVKSLARKLLKAYPHIDLLLNNAGGIMKEIKNTGDEFEQTFQVNYVAQFYLTELLLDRLIESKAGIINTSSVASRLAHLNLNNLETAKSPMRAYANTKLLDIIHAKEITRRYANLGLIAVSFHPGVVATNFAKGTGGVFDFVYNSFLSKFIKTPEDGADTMIWLARNRQKWTPGAYYIKRKIKNTPKIANNKVITAAIWDTTQKDIITHLV